MDNSPKAAEIIAEHERSVARVQAALRVAGMLLFAAGVVTMAVALTIAAVEVAP